MTNRLHAIWPLAALALAWSARPAAAQSPAPPPGAEPLARIVAVVGDSIITNFQLQEDLLQVKATGGTIPTDPVQLNELEHKLLKNRVDELILLQAAQRDTTIKLDQDRINAHVQTEVTQHQQNFATPQDFQNALEARGLTLAQYQQVLTTQARKQALIQAYLANIQRDRKPPAVTEEEIENFFNAQKDQLKERPATITFDQIVVSEQPTPAAKAAARALADTVLAKLHAGGDFAKLARQYSDDPGTKDKGGELGWFRHDRMVKAFADAVYALRPGQISGVVESPYGFHIIQLEKARGAERDARHILITPELVPQDTVRAIAKANEVMAKLKAGDVPVDTLIAHYNDPMEDQTHIGPFPVTQLPPPYDQALAHATSGDVIGPVRLTDAGKPEWAVVKVEDFTAAGEYSLDDPAVHEQVRKQLEQQKLMEEIIQEQRAKTYVDIRL